MKTKNLEVFCLFECSFGGSELIDIFGKESDALKAKAMLENSLPAIIKPEYDELGLIEGTEYLIGKWNIK